ncbi:MAG: type II toxin-antitoxin system PemK/MazF family toxin [Candidatus Omnitrophica bacterium]|nr:type II toxin-antitoxin system PemK/MazF family toxin [Candidatus Omnitrophota bacterium]
MTAYSIYAQGAVVLIPFPFTDFSTIKQRPAVIISSNEFNRAHDDVIALAITSRIPESPTVENYVLSREEIDSARLPKPSLVKIGKIVTINKVLIRKRLGTLPQASIENIRTKLLAIL